MERLGIALGSGLSPTETVECVRLAEQAGYESAWIVEGHGGDQFSLLTACALATNRIRLGTAISSVFVRTAPTIAMAAACVDHFSNGRFVLGLGSSPKGPGRDRARHPLRRPSYARARDRGSGSRTAARRRGLISWQDDHYRAFRSMVQTGAQFGADLSFCAVPQMLGLCGEVAQGLLMVFATPGSLSTAVEHLSAGAARAGRDVKEIEIVLPPPASVRGSRSGLRTRSAGAGLLRRLFSTLPKGRQEKQGLAPRSTLSSRRQSAAMPRARMPRFRTKWWRG